MYRFPRSIPSLIRSQHGRIHIGCRSMSTSEKLWGGRFEKDTDEAAVNWAESLTCDHEMVKEDLWGSMAHVTMLGHQGVIPAGDAGKIIQQLLEFQEDFMGGKLNFFEEKFKNHDDVHMNMEARLIDKLGMDVGGRMHTTRSRNDQVPVSSKLHSRNLLLETRRSLLDVVQSFLDRAKEPGADTTVMPGYTHFQHAQPISTAFWMSHYASAHVRDLRRMKAAYDLLDENPLGGGAISGTSFPIDRSITTDLLGFQRTQTHALDATGHRDWMLDVLNSNATMQSTFSRLAEELIMWSSYEFRTVTLDDGFAMGSSMMPQKKNPGTLELLRGRTGIINGYMVAGHTMLHGLPSGYNRDFHEEKELLFASLRMVTRCANLVPAVVRSTTFNKERMKELCNKNFMTATELANYLVLHHEVPFRETHHIVGSLVGKLTRSGRDMTDTKAVLDHLRESGIPVDGREAEDIVLKSIDPEQIMLSYESEGGTGPRAVAAIVAEIEDELARHTTDLEKDQVRVTNGWNATRTIASMGSTVKTAQDLHDLLKKHRPAQTPNKSSFGDESDLKVA